MRMELEYAESVIHGYMTLERPRNRGRSSEEGSMLKKVMIGRRYTENGGEYAIYARGLNHGPTYFFCPRVFEKVTGFKLPIGADPIRVTVLVHKAKAKKKKHT